MATPSERLNSLLANPPYFGDRLTELVAAAVDWNYQEPAASSFAVLSALRICAEKEWDDENKLTNQEMRDFVAHVIPTIQTTLTEHISPTGSTIQTLNKLAVAVRDCFHDASSPISITTPP